MDGKHLMKGIMPMVPCPMCNGMMAWPPDEPAPEEHDWCDECISAVQRLVDRDKGGRRGVLLRTIIASLGDVMQGPDPRLYTMRMLMKEVVHGG